MSYDKVQVGNRIRGSRLEKGWTQERLAAEAEISVQQLRALEKGQRNLGVDHSVCVFGAKERIEQCDLMQKNSADVSAICGKSRILFFNVQKRGRIGKRFSI